ncbi:T9SS type A sorting domain-containing protein [Catalinimonas sp. 4WD22]|uniref:T9SS type A sorting domain-containing protein n=1 Tax=Catalinimonas locisalis TaxID=3133978 RepID=UPI003100FD71
MKRLIYTITLLAFSFSAFGQVTYNTTNTTPSLWSDNIWTKSETWASDIPGSVSSNTRSLGSYITQVNINGWVTEEGNLIINGSSIVTIKSDQRLTIAGNLTITGSGDINIEEGGILIVMGNMVMDGGSLSSNEGTILVMEDLQVSGGADFNSTEAGNSYVLGETTRSGGAKFNGQDDPGKSNVYGETEFMETDLYNELISVQPIKLLSFTGVAQNNTVQLDWVTASEENFDFFTVERAGADLKFEAIGKVGGTGNTTTEVAYDFADKSPLQGQAFYRLKATDYDGSVEYHKIISVFFDGFVSSNTSVYPNPVVDNTFKVNSTAEDTQEIRLLDLSGKTVYSTTLPTGLQEVTLPEAIRPGAYLLMVTGNRGAVHQQKIMVI